MPTEITTGSLQGQVGDWVTLEDSGAAINANAFQQITSAGKPDIAKADLEGAEFIDLLITGMSFTVAPAVGSVVNVLLRPINIDTASDDEPVPSTNYRKVAKSFRVQATTDSSVYLVEYIPAPRSDCEVFFENAAGQQISSGYVVKFRAHTVGPKPAA